MKTLSFTRLNPRFANADRDQNRVTSMLVDLSGSPLVVSGFSLSGIGAAAVAIVDGSGNQITSFGGGTQYTDAASAPTHPIGTGIIFNNGGTFNFVSAAQPLPVSATFSPSGTQDVNLKQVGGTTFALGQQLAAASLPIVLTAAQLTTLTPPSNTGYALDSSLTTIDTDLKSNITLHAGSNLIGKVGIDQTTPGTTNAVAIQDGAGNALTTNSTTFTAKKALDVNMLGTLGTAFSAAGKVDVKGADGDVFVRQATGTNLHAVIDSGTITTVSAVTAISNALPAGTNNIGFVTPTPGTTGGWSVNSQTALTNTKVAVKASAGTFGGYMLYNPNTTIQYIQVFDVASGSVTLGSTTPTYVIPIPGGAAANLEIGNGINHATAITLAATTTPTGSTAPGSNLVGFFLFK